MLCSVFILEVSLFCKSKITRNFIQCTFFLSVSVSSHAFPHTPFLPSVFLKHVECRNQIYSKRPKTLKCCPAMATRSLKMETQAGRLHSDHTQPQLTFRKFWSVKKANVQNLWGPGELVQLKAEFNLKKIAERGKYSRSLPLVIHLPWKCWKCLGFHNKNVKPESVLVCYHNAFAVTASITEKSSLANGIKRSCSPESFTLGYSN